MTPVPNLETQPTTPAPMTRSPLAQREAMEFPLSPLLTAPRVRIRTSLVGKTSNALLQPDLPVLTPKMAGSHRDRRSSSL
jgi:hypothetical protein